MQSNAASFYGGGIYTQTLLPTFKIAKYCTDCLKIFIRLNSVAEHGLRETLTELETLLTE